MGRFGRGRRFGGYGFRYGGHPMPLTRYGGGRSFASMILRLLGIK